MTSYDAIVVGAGPNGLAAAVTLASSGLGVLVVEGDREIGGGTRSRALTVEGAIHDVCSAVHPLGIGSPLFRVLGLERDGLEWIESPTPLAHVMEDGSAVTLERSLAETAEGLGADGARYADLLAPFVERFGSLAADVLAPLRIPRHPLLLGRFGVHAVRSMVDLARDRFAGHGAPALLAGIAAHAMMPLEEPTTAAIALVLAIAGHARGWPVARGGSRAIAEALAARFRSLGGEITTGSWVRSLDDLPRAHAYVLDVAPKGLLAIAGKRLSPGYVRRVSAFRYGPGVFKMDCALDAPVPWLDERCRRAVTVHLSGAIDEVASTLRALHEGTMPRRPFVLVGQPSIVDASRAPAGIHTVWAYCHVPSGSEIDASDSIERRIEEFAPGFRRSILGRSTRNARQHEEYDPNYVGGDINGGRSDWSQLFFRPVVSVDPYSTSDPSIFLCSSSTPPGGGVHGMCGYWAAKSVLRRRFRRDVEIELVRDD